MLPQTSRCIPIDRQSAEKSGHLLQCHFSCNCSRLVHIVSNAKLRMLVLLYDLNGYNVRFKFVWCWDTFARVSLYKVCLWACSVISSSCLVSRALHHLCSSYKQFCQVSCILDILFRQQYIDVSENSCSCLKEIFQSPWDNMLLHTDNLDYCNSLLHGLPDKLINRLKCLHNIAARVVSHTSKFEHITPVMYELPWLPVRMRLRFK